MKLPDPVNVYNNFIDIEEYLNQFVKLLSKQDYLDFTKFQDNKHSLNMKIIRIWRPINILTLKDKQYSKAYEGIRKILLRLLTDLDNIEKKHLKSNIISWETKYKKGLLRRDLIRFFKDISKQMKKIEKNLIYI